MITFDPQKSYEPTTRSRSLIRFQDCDPLCHLNNAKYFDYYFNAREDQVPKLYGFTQSELYSQFQATWVVYNHQIAYVRPAGMGEWVRIFSRVIWHDEKTVLVEYFMTDDAEKQLKNVLWSTLRYVDFQGVAKEHPELITQYLSAVCLPDFDITATDFQQRIKAIKKEIAAGQIK